MFAVDTTSERRDTGGRNQRGQKRGGEKGCEWQGRPIRKTRRVVRKCGSGLRVSPLGIPCRSFVRSWDFKIVNNSAGFADDLESGGERTSSAVGYVSSGPRVPSQLVDIEYWGYAGLEV